MQRREAPRERASSQSPELRLVVSRHELPRGRPARRYQVAEYVSLVVLAIFSGYFAWLLRAEPFSDEVRLVVSDASSTLVPLVGGAVTIALFLRSARTGGAPWLLIGLGSISWGLGEAVWSFHEVVLNEPSPFPSLADIGYLAAVPFIYVGLLLFSQQSATRSLNRRLILKAAALCLAIVLVSWLFVLRPLYGDATQGLLGRVIGLAYPTSDVLFLLVLAVASRRGWRAQDRPVVCALALGIVALVYADLGFALLELHGLYETGSFFGFGWPVGFLLLMHAAIVRRSALAKAGGAA